MSAIDRIKDETTQAFATACYDDNSPSELRDALANGADETDMKTWGIDEGQWIEAVNAALIDLEEDQGDTYKLHEIGQALFGVSWQTDMARALDIKDARRVRQWLSLDRTVPAGVWDDLKRITRERGQRLLELSESL